MENTVESANMMANNVAAAEQGSWLGMLLYCAKNDNKLK